LAIPSILIALALHFSGSQESRKAERHLSAVMRDSEQRQTNEIRKLGDLLVISQKAIDSFKAVDQDDKETLRSAQNMLKTDPIHAAHLLDTLSRKYQDLAAVPFLRGSLAFHLGRYDEALRHYEVALYFRTEDAKAWYNHGVVLGKLRRYEEALASYDSAIVYQPRFAEVWVNRGAILGEQGRNEDALVCFDSALVGQPNDASAWYNRGVVLARLGHHIKALASYDSALVHQPDDASAWYNRGVLLITMVRYEAAVASLDSALATSAASWTRRGEAKLLKDRLAEALRAR
jgi:tetratricopeptide (TPR) repeat protein